VNACAKRGYLHHFTCEKVWGMGCCDGDEDGGERRMSNGKEAWPTTTKEVHL
jgi:hypothetical protein